jgi:hypothetical protein
MSSNPLVNAILVVAVIIIVLLLAYAFVWKYA